MISPITYNLPAITKRSNYDFMVQLLNIHENPVNLAEYEILCHMWDIKREIKYGEFNLEVISTELALLKFYLTPEQTQRLPLFGFYDVKIITLDDSKEYYIIKGTFTTTAGYTDN